MAKQILEDVDNIMRSNVESQEITR